MTDKSGTEKDQIKFPSPEDIQRELTDFVKGRFGKDTSFFMSPEAQAEEPLEDEPDFLETVRDFSLTPKDVKAHLDRYVIGQSEAKKTLAVAFCDHYNHARINLENQVDLNDPEESHYSKQNVLLLGPTGVGKTYLVRTLSQLAGVPFVKADATRFSETGYMGANVDDLIRDLVRQADGNIKLAEYGIVYIDEGDKLASQKSQFGKDVSGRGVQMALLKLMEKTQVDLRAGNDPASQMQAFLDLQKGGEPADKIVDTSHILFIVSGAFSGLDEIVEKRLGSTAIGFKKEGADSAYDLEPTTEDLIEYGFEPEFVGRLPIQTSCHPLSIDHLFTILKESEGSIIRQYLESFAAYGIEISFTDEALKVFARRAKETGTGARALMTECEKVLRNAKYELPSSNIEQFVIDEEFVLDPKKGVAKLLENPPTLTKKARKEILSFTQGVEEALEQKVSLEFNEKLQTRIAGATKGNLTDFCRSKFEHIEHALLLINNNTGQSSFEFTEDFYDNPANEIDGLIKKSYEARNEF